MNEKKNKNNHNNNRKKKCIWKKKKKEKGKKKEYIPVTLLVELSQVIWSAACWHKSSIPSQFKVPFDSNELYQSIKIFWSPILENKILIK